MARPWLFVDLDGVVSALPPRDGTDAQRSAIPAGHMTWPGALYQMHVDQRLPQWAAQLDAAYEVMWATSWQTDVRKCVGRMRGGLAAWLALRGAHRLLTGLGVPVLGDELAGDERRALRI